ncbi:uncharacterized protein LOC131943662 [Physella acuta]|uniref:uncharacterized protein LOC131943662 n=1 Tax=Physella acuta TaxID=109671 RepID=UPI0027DE4937|nr:uncharacterized protein LOC131943662 [Physella acuta]XP_059159852.1 uncharacterized protein LOC131943662 [Physella acuta]
MNTMQEFEPSEEQYGSPPKDQQDTPQAANINCPLCQQDPPQAVLDNGYCLLCEQDTSKAVLVNRYCPLCQVPNCKHFELLQKLRNPPTSNVKYCELKNHNKELKLFCKVCIEPICEECNNAEHKLHDVQELYKVQRDLKKNLMLQMLNKKCINSEADENSLKESILSQIKNIKTEIQLCYENLHNEINVALQRAIYNLDNLSKELQTECDQTLQKYKNCQSFLSEFANVLEVSEDNHSHIIYALKFRQEVLDLFYELNNNIQQLPKTVEKCVSLTYQPALPVVEVQVAAKNLKPVSVNRLPDKFFRNVTTKSLIVLSSDECLISCKAIASDLHPIYLCDTSKTGDMSIRRFFTDGEWCFLAQLKSKEIIALCKNGASSAVKYNDGSFLSSYEQYIEFETIKELDSLASSIAVTNDNNIIVCVSCDEKKDQDSGHGYVMLMSLRGKVIRDTVADFGRDMISPDYVAVSDRGEICVSNSRGNSVIILNEDLEIVKSIEFLFPTSFIYADHPDKLAFLFSPCGLCYDHLNRIIVTDLNHCTVLRLSVDTMTKDYKMEPLIIKGKKLEQFHFPQFTAMGTDRRLWVVCKDDLFVFEYYQIQVFSSVE